MTETVPPPNVIYEPPNGAMMDEEGLVQRMLDSESVLARSIAVGAVLVYAFGWAGPTQALRDRAEQRRDLDAAMFKETGMRSPQGEPHTEQTSRLGAFVQRAMSNIQGRA